MAPAVALSRLHTDPEEPMPHVGHSTVLGPLDDAALDAFAAHAQPGAPLLFAELRQLGGALARVPEGAGATGSFECDYLYLSAGPAFEPAMGRPCTRQASACSRRSPRTRPGPRSQLRERAVDPSAFFSAGTYERLRAIRAAVDPHGVMVSNHAIPAA